jgi:hypothetical protein
MSKDFLLKELEVLGPATRDNRQRVSNLVIDNPDLVSPLLEIVFDVDHKLSYRAAWILEFVLTQKNKLDWIAPYLTKFTSNISRVYHDSSVRPCAKICEYIAKAYTSKKDSIVKDALEKKHIEKIIETGFDWMISKQKVAVKAYTMETLYLLGKDYDWVYEELKLVIEQNMASGSAGYKARGKKILALIDEN